MKLEVGMYCRDDKGIICKIENIMPKELNPKYEELYLLNNDFYYTKEEIGKKTSFNIIDLIEVGDYVNGSRVVYFMIDEEKSINEGIDEKIGVIVEEEWEGKKYLTKDIKSILTKEQYEANTYKVVE